MDDPAPLQLEPEPTPQTPAPVAPGPPAPAVVVRDVARAFKPIGRRARQPARVALDGVSFEVPAGRWAALLGPNGSGKSTLFRILATLDKPDRGTLDVAGRSTAADPAGVRSALGVVFQRVGLDPVLTGRENLMLQAELYAIPRAEAESRAAALALELGFADRQHDRVGKLSGGLARRVDLARALLTQPAVLLLDEPTNGLDLDTRRAFLDLLAARVRSTGLTILMSTHQIDEAERADLVIMLAAGRVVAAGEAAELRRSLGGMVVHARPQDAALLTESGLIVQRITTTTAVGAGDAPSIERAAVALTRAGAWFHVGPPTLGDAYLAKTGSPLSGEGGSAVAAASGEAAA